MSEHRLVAVTLDPDSLAPSPNADIEHERTIAIFDLIEANQFEVEGKDEGPYALELALREGRLVFSARRAADAEEVRAVILSLTGFRRIIKDYFLVCDSYFDAIRHATPAHIEAIDVGRRSLHNQGSALLEQRLKGKFRIDFDTARRLFTLICALQASR